MSWDVLDGLPSVGAYKLAHAHFPLIWFIVRYRSMTDNSVYDFDGGAFEVMRTGVVGVRVICVRIWVALEDGMELFTFYGVM